MEENKLKLILASSSKPRQDAVSEYEYKFEDFDDSISVEPNINEYIVEEQ